MASGSGEPTLLDCIAMEEALNEEEEEEEVKPATTAKLKSTARPQRQSDVDDIFSDVGTNDVAQRSEKRKRLKERQDVSDAISTASSARRKKSSDVKASYGPADAMAKTKAGSIAAEEDAQVRKERVADAEAAAASGKPKKRKERAPEPQPAKLPKEQEDVVNQAFKDAGGLVFPVSPKFPDRSDKSALRLGSLLGAASMTSLTLTGSAALLRAFRWSRRWRTPTVTMPCSHT